MARVQSFFNGLDRDLNVRVVFPGDKYGLNFKLTNDGDEPLVEFWDASQDAEKFGPLGQFVARYYLSAMLEHAQDGLYLDGVIPVWQITAEAWYPIKKFLRRFK